MCILQGIKHGMLLFKYGIETLVPDSPSDIGKQLRSQFLVSKVCSGDKF